MADMFLLILASFCGPTTITVFPYPDPWRHSFGATNSIWSCQRPPRTSLGKVSSPMSVDSYFVRVLHAHAISIRGSTFLIVQFGLNRTYISAAPHHHRSFSRVLPQLHTPPESHCSSIAQTATVASIPFPAKAGHAVTTPWLAPPSHGSAPGHQK